MATFPIVSGTFTLPNNPTRFGVATVTESSGGTASISVVDPNGRHVFDAVLGPRGSVMTAGLNLTDLVPGLYTVTVTGTVTGTVTIA